MEADVQAAAKKFRRGQRELSTRLGKLLARLDREDAENRLIAQDAEALADAPQEGNESEQPADAEEVEGELIAHQARIDAENTHERRSTYQAFARAVNAAANEGELNEQAYRDLFALVGQEIAQRKGMQANFNTSTDAIDEAASGAGPEWKKLADAASADMGRMKEKGPNKELAVLEPAHAALAELMRDSGLLPPRGGPGGGKPPDRPR